MKHSIVCAILFVGGTGAGYAIYPLCHDSGDVTSLVAAKEVVVAPHATSMLDTQPERKLQQASRITPLVPVAVDRFSTPDSSDHCTAPRTVEQPFATQANAAAKQALAFNDASNLVEQMIARQAFTREGLLQAISLLQQTGQAERSFELQARILNAVNSGELNPEQVNLTPNFVLEQQPAN
jgi:hypothetical protein